MHTSRSACFALIAACALPLAKAAQENAAPAPAAAPFAIDLRISPIVDLYYELRARAAAGETVAEEDPLASALAAASALDRELGWILFWGPLDGRLGDCRTAAELEAAFADLPETLARRDRSGAEQEVRLRELALALAHAIGPLETSWLAERWPERAARLEEAAAELRLALESEDGTALRRSLCDALLMEVEGVSVPALLVQRAPEPGAVTYRRAGGGGLSFVGLAGLEGSALVEVLVHESIHALDVATAEQDTLLQQLRRALAEAGVATDDRRSHDTVHALFFLFSGELVRRHLDPEHVDYGDRAGVYTRLSAPIEATRPFAHAYLQGEIESEELVAGIVEAVAAAK